MTKKEKARIVVESLEKRYPEAICSLVADKPYELLIATRLSAQCTDARVNIVANVKIFYITAKCVNIIYKTVV